MPKDRSIWRTEYSYFLKQPGLGMGTVIWDSRAPNNKTVRDFEYKILDDHLYIRTVTRDPAAHRFESVQVRQAASEECHP
jgi:hypothetical protein